jgi:hypothetical protein
MFGKNTSSGTNVDVNVTLDLNNPSFAGTTTINELAISDSGTTITGANSHELHFNNTDGYYAFHINNYPYFYITQDACYVNTTLAIDSNDKQILFYREHNFWFFNADNNDNKLIIKSGSGDLPSDNNWNNYAFEFYQNGDFTVPGKCSSTGLYNTSTLHQGGAATFLSSITSNCLQNQFQIHNVNNFWYLSAAAYSTQSATNKLTLWPGYTINHTQDEPFEFYQNGNFKIPGVLYANSLTPNYNTPPALAITQVGGKVSMSFDENGTYTTGYNYVTATVPMGYYLVQGYLDLTPVSNNQTIVLGLSFDTTSIDAEYSQYYKFESTARNYLQFNYYVNQENGVNYNFIFYSNSTVYVTKGRKKKERKRKTKS